MGSLDDSNERMVDPRHLLEFCWVWGDLLKSLETASKPCKRDADRSLYTIQLEVISSSCLIAC